MVRARIVKCKGKVKSAIVGNRVISVKVRISRYVMFGS